MRYIECYYLFGLSNNILCTQIFRRPLIFLKGNEVVNENSFGFEVQKKFVISH